MVYVTFGAAVQRAEPATSLRTPVMFTVAAVGGASVAGVALGALGSISLRDGANMAAAAFLGVAAIALGVLDLLGHPAKIPQRDCETPREWLRRRRWAAAVRNGLALGTGWSTRIGFWLWFVVPFGAFLSGSPLMGLAIYAAYGFTRGIGPWLLLLLGKAYERISSRRHPDSALWVIGQYRAMNTLSSVQLVMLGVIAVAVFVR